MKESSKIKLYNKQSKKLVEYACQSERAETAALKCTGNK